MRGQTPDVGRTGVRPPLRIDSRLLNLQFVARDVVGADLAVAVQAESETVVHRAQPHPIRIAVEPEIALPQRSRAIARPLRQRGRYTFTRMRAPDREPMHERRIAPVDLR